MDRRIGIGRLGFRSDRIRWIQTQRLGLKGAGRRRRGVPAVSGRGGGSPENRVNVILGSVLGVVWIGSSRVMRGTDWGIYTGPLNGGEGARRWEAAKRRDLAPVSVFSRNREGGEGESSRRATSP